ncbi:MAG TPA: c-type cytochrome, partial [Thermomicrobiales bacterium]|nr:c-type cytochrome [Thermomicrobiales bacterium]
VEHQPLAGWADRALTEPDAAKQVEALLALARAAGIDPQHRKPGDPPVDAAMQTRLLAALDRIDCQRLGHEQRLAYLRTIEIALVRFGRPDEATVDRMIARLDPLFPAARRELNWLLCETLAYLQSPTAAAKGMALIEAAPTQEEQIEYARSLRMLRTGWTTETHAAYFRWLVKAASSFRGGASFDKFIEFIRNDAVASLSEAERTALRDVLAEKPVRKSPLEGLSTLFAGRPKTEWTIDALSLAAQTGLKDRSFENGRKMFGAAACFTCHRFANEGGMTGPDLSSAGRRYAVRDLLAQIIDPNKEINEQFVSMVVVTRDEEVIQGMIVNLNGDAIMLNTDPADPNQQRTIDRKEVASIEPSKISPMPTGLLGPLTKDEILDLLAYVLSGGDPRHALFRQ